MPKELKFRKKPVVVEAYQTNVPLEIETLEGIMHASPGDWIITGVNGEKYPCKPDIFEKTYEPVNNSEKHANARKTHACVFPQLKCSCTTTKNSCTTTV